jgi:hypothetical protein
MRYPDDFPAAFAAAAKRCDVGVASLQAEQAALYKKKLGTMHLLHP